MAARVALVTHYYPAHRGGVERVAGQLAERLVAEGVAEIEKLLGRPVKVEYSAARAVDVPVNVLDSSLAERHLGWRAGTPLGEGLRRTCEWLRASPS